MARIPIACTLTSDDVPSRLAEWRGVLEHVRERSTLGDGAVRVEFDPAIDVGELARLVAAEQHCCAFFAFALTVDDRGIGLEVRAPEDATPIVESLFGST